MYYLLTESFKEQQQKMVSMILECAEADTIYLLGSTLHTRRTESIFMTDAPACHSVGHYYVLVLLTGRHNLNEVQDKIESKCSNFVSTTAIVLNADRFEEWLMDGHAFARTVIKIAVCIYGEKHMLPYEKEKAKDEERQREDAFKDSLTKVTEFIAGAELYMLRKQNSLAAFMLHQAAEQALHAVFCKATGMHLHTHNIERLLRYCTMLSYQLPEVIFTSKEEDKKLLSLLQKAYTGGRYDRAYIIKVSELEKLIERIIVLKKIIYTLV